MERGDVARLLQVADADVESYELAPDGLFVNLRDCGRIVVATEGVFACDDHPANRQLRPWPGRDTSLPGYLVPAPEVVVAVPEGIQPGEWASTQGDGSGEPLPEAVPDGTIDEILAWVDGNPERALQAYEVEETRDKPRSTLLAKLEELVSA